MNDLEDLYFIQKKKRLIRIVVTDLPLFLLRFTQEAEYLKQSW